MFKASIDPHGDTLNDIRTTLLTHGTTAIPRRRSTPSRSTAARTRGHRAGEHAVERIESPHDILFLKNELNRNVHAPARCARACDSPAQGVHPADSYVSPRTKAACRDVLTPRPC
jgi:hypothetical protein